MRREASLPFGSVRHAAGRARTAGHSCRLLMTAVLTAILAAPSSGQSSRPGGASGAAGAVCRERPPERRIANGWYVAPQGVATADGRVHLLGDPFLAFDPAATPPRIVDSSQAGLTVPDGDRPQVIGQPVPGLLLDHPRLRRAAPDVFDVVFTAMPTRELLQERRDSIQVWGARLVRGEWRDVTLIRRVPRRSSTNRQTVGEAVTYRDELVAALVELGGPTAEAALTLVRGRAGRWRTERIRLEGRGPSYVDLAVQRDTLWVAMSIVAPGASREEAGIGVWTFFLRDDGWSVPRLLAARPGLGLHEVRLLPTEEGLVVAWLDGDASSLRLYWRSVAEGPGAVIHDLPTHSWTSRGLEDYAHWLTATVSDSVAQVLELTPSGHRVVAEVPTMLGVAPPVLGIRGRPRVISPQYTRDTVPVPLWLSEFDLRCAIRGLGAGVDRTATPRASFAHARAHTPP